MTEKTDASLGWGTEATARMKQLIGHRIRIARVEGGMTQAGISAELGYGQRWLSEIERGNNQIAFADLIRIANILERPIEFFVTGLMRAPYRPPREMHEWEALYQGDPDRASAHYSLDRVFQDRDERRRREARSGTSPEDAPPKRELVGAGSF